MTDCPIYLGLSLFEYEKSSVLGNPSVSGKLGQLVTLTLALIQLILSLALLFYREIKHDKMRLHLRGNLAIPK